MKIIAITGASGSGKTTAAKQLLAYYGEDAVIISLDAYYKGRLLDQLLADFMRQNFDHPSAFNFQLLANHLAQLQKGEPFTIPNFDMATGFSTEDGTKIEPKKIIIIEGILILHDPAIRKFIDTSVFIAIEPAIALSRRLSRDKATRNLDHEHTLNAFEQYIYPMYMQFIRPWEKLADIVIHNSDHSINNTLDIDAIINKISKKTIGNHLPKAAKERIVTKGTVFLIMGPYGVGKTTALKRLEQNEKFTRVVAYTTRKKRSGEIDGVDYHFISTDFFTELNDSNYFLATFEMNANRYGITYACLTNLNAGEHVLMDVHPKTAEIICSKIAKCTTIFIAPPSLETLRTRMIARGDNADSVQQRMLLAKEYMNLSTTADYIFINHAIETTVNKISQVINATERVSYFPVNLGSNAEFFTSQNQDPQPRHKTTNPLYIGCMK